LVSGPAHPSTLGPQSLSSVQVDVATRLGAPSAFTPTGFRGLDALLLGGLRGGTSLGIVGEPGSGRTAVALMLAYMAARTQAGVCFAARGLDETELVARLAARALRKSYPSSELTYGDILSGNALTDTVRRAVSAAVETVVEKIGQHFYFSRLPGGTSLGEWIERTVQLWGRHERMLLVFDDIEGLLAPGEPLDSGLLRIGYDLKALAERGYSVVFTVLEVHTPLIAPTADALLRLTSPGLTSTQQPRRLELQLIKNRRGATGAVSLEVLFGVSEFREDTSLVVGPT
jgi:hypothetical protein